MMYHHLHSSYMWSGQFLVLHALLIINGPSHTPLPTPHPPTHMKWKSLIQQWIAWPGGLCGLLMINFPPAQKNPNPATTTTTHTKWKSSIQTVEKSIFRGKWLHIMP